MGWILLVPLKTSHSCPVWGLWGWELSPCKSTNKITHFGIFPVISSPFFVIFKKIHIFRTIGGLFNLGVQKFKLTSAKHPGHMYFEDRTCSICPLPMFTFTFSPCDYWPQWMFPLLIAKKSEALRWHQVNISPGQITVVFKGKVWADMAQCYVAKI